MNKIILDKESKVDLRVFEDSECFINEEYEISELNIYLENNVKFIVNHISNIKNNDLNINIKQENNSEFIYNHNFINKDSYNLFINILLNQNNSKNNINIKGITDSGNTKIVIDGKVEKDTKDNELDEKIKIFNINKGKTIIEPNMYIDTKNVIANHSASISDFDESYLFYLNSKGISSDEAKKLIIKGFLNID